MDDEASIHNILGIYVIGSLSFLKCLCFMIISLSLRLEYKSRKKKIRFCHFSSFP